MTGWIKAKFHQFRDFFNKLSADHIIASGTALQVIVAAIAAYVIIYQFQEANKLKQFDNYIYFNKIYSDWYDEFPKNMGTTWNQLSDKEKTWIRRYIDLYSQEYYFYLHKMIPPEMWEEVLYGKNGCDSAAMVNFRVSPIIVTGYIEWKKLGAFKYPPDFIKVLDDKLKECQLYPKY
jgi:hypothetical protein